MLNSSSIQYLKQLLFAATAKILAVTINFYAETSFNQLTFIDIYILKIQSYKSPIKGSILFHSRKALAL